MKAWLAWVPAGLLGLGAVGVVGVDTQQRMPLVAPLESVVPTEIDGLEGRELVVSPEELRVAGVSDHLMRVYRGDAEAEASYGFTVYVGYYDQQTQGRTIHSPKNCLPGSGWEALASEIVMVDTPDGPVPANRYRLQRQKTGENALVLYWYQGRGRVEANEYKVKWQLLRDAAIKKRTEEALVRIVVPITESEDQAFEQATRVAATVIPAVSRALPGSQS
jgi:EpsI family protein